MGIWLLLPFLRWWHTALALFSTRWSNGSCTDLRLPGRHLGMNERASAKAQPDKDWASYLPCHSNSTAWLHDSVRLINNYTINFDHQLTFKEYVAKTARLCRFALHNIRKIRPFLTEHAAQLLVQALVISRLDYCKALRMQRHDCSSTSPKEPILHLSLSTCTGYQLQLASSSRHWCLQWT